MSNIDELIIHHIHTPVETLLAYRYLDHTDWEEYVDGQLLSLVSYFGLEYEYDMIIAINRDNIFTLGQWKYISKLLKTRTKEIRISSDPINKILHKGAKKYNGYFVDDYIVFPVKKEK